MGEEDKGIQGIKKSEWKTAREVLGDDAPADVLPASLRLYIKERALDIAGRKLGVNLYRMLDDGGIKEKRSWVHDFGPEVPDEKRINELFGPSKYIWIAKWTTHDGKESGIVSEPVIIDEACRPAHEAYQEKLRALKPVTLAPAAPLPVVAPAAPSGGIDIGGILAIMAAAEEKTLSTMERMARMFKPAETPADVLRDTYKAGNAMMKEATDVAMSSYRAVTAKAKAEMNAKPDEDEGGEKDGADPDSVSGMVKTFLPEIKAYLDKLIGGGPVGAAVKTLVLGSEQWKEIFQDKEKFGIAIAAMEQEFGSEKTERVLDVLLNRRKDQGSKSKGKGK